MRWALGIKFTYLIERAGEVSSLTGKDESTFRSRLNGYEVVAYTRMKRHEELLE